MLEGLEIKEVLLSELYLDNEKFRIDDEFFLKEYLQAYKKVKSKPHTILGKELSVLTDFHSNGSYEVISKNFVLLDEPDYAYMVRTTDLEQNNFSQGVKYISKQSYDFLDKSKIFGGELLINKIGSPGRSYLMPNLNSPASLGMNLFMARVRQSEYLNEKFLYIYLNTITGSRIISRKLNGTVPLTIDKMAVKSLYVPKFSHGLVVKISDYVDQSDKMNSESKVIYQQAKTLLLETLNLADFAIPQQQVNIKSFSESFGVSGRLDAEYYQEKYDSLISQLKEIEFDYLKNIVKIRKSIEPGSEFYSECGTPFIRVADLNQFEIAKPDKFLSENYCNKNHKLINDLKPKTNTILFSKDGTVGIAYLLTEDLEGITSGAILHLNISDKRILPEYLTLLLNSKAVQMQAERDVGGSIIPHWRIEEIENVVIPIIDMDIQNEIANLIRQSQILRTQSKQLLEYAKQAVEIAIEQGEEKALNFLKNIAMTNVYAN